MEFLSCTNLPLPLILQLVVKALDSSFYQSFLSSLVIDANKNDSQVNFPSFTLRK